MVNAVLHKLSGISFEIIFSLFFEIVPKAQGYLLISWDYKLHERVYQTGLFHLLHTSPLHHLWVDIGLVVLRIAECSVGVGKWVVMGLDVTIEEEEAVEGFNLVGGEVGKVVVGCGVLHL
jgi:hypothetical protein